MKLPWRQKLDRVPESCPFFSIITISFCLRWLLPLFDFHNIISCFRDFYADHVPVNCAVCQHSAVSARTRKICDTPSPARRSSTIGLLPDVIYRVDMPRATSGCARRAARSALSAIAFARCFFTSRFVEPFSSSWSLPCLV